MRVDSSLRSLRSTRSAIRMRERRWFAQPPQSVCRSQCAAVSMPQQTAVVRSQCAAGCVSAASRGGNHASDGAKLRLLLQSVCSVTESLVHHREPISSQPSETVLLTFFTVYTNKYAGQYDLEIPSEYYCFRFELCTQSITC